MKINKLNYEVYIIDYIEGTLSNVDSATFKQFLSEHPEVETEIADYLTAPVLEENPAIIYDRKDEHLKSSKRKSGAAALLLILVLLTTSIYYFQTIRTETQSTAHATIAFKKAATEENSNVKATGAKKAEKNTYNKEAQKKETNSQQSSKTNLITKNDNNNSKKNSDNNQRASKNDSKTKNITLEQKKAQNANSHSEQQLQKTNNLLIAKKKAAKKPTDNSPASFIPMAVTTPRELQKSPAVLSNRAMITTLTSMENTRAADIEKLAQKNTITTITNDQLASQDSPKEKFWNLFKPQAYQDINIKDALASQSLKSAELDKEIDILPQNYFTK